MVHTDEAIDCDCITDRINADKEIIPDHKYNTQDLCKSHPEDQAEPEYFLASFQVSSSKVLTRKCDCRLCKGTANIIGKILKIQCQRGTCNRILPKCINSALDKYIGDRKDGTLNSGRNSQSSKFFSDPSIAHTFYGNGTEIHLLYGTDESAPWLY